MNRGPAPSRRRPAGGFISLVVLCLLCLMVMPMLVMAALSREESLLSRKTALKGRASHLAAYAFWEWLARSEGGEAGFVPDASPCFAARQTWSSAAVDGAWDGFAYRAQGAFRPDLHDEDGLAPTTIVLHNRAFGFADSPFEEGGYPVLDILAESVVGQQRDALRAAVTLIPYRPPAAAALVSGGPLRIVGPALVNGRPHLAGGEPDADALGVPAIRGLGSLDTDGEVTLVDGEEPAGVDLTPEAIRDPYRVLGLDPGGRYLEKRPCLRLEPPWSGTIHFKETYRGNVSGRGTLVVHNPRFDPLRYKASLDYYQGFVSEHYDPAYSHLDPANQPAVLEPAGDGLFCGLVIADDLVPGPGRLEIRGQVFILSSLSVSPGMAGGLTVLYSPEALREYAHGDWDNILSWRPGSGR